jgi:hypothetical protein
MNHLFGTGREDEARGSLRAAAGGRVPALHKIRVSDLMRRLTAGNQR